MEINKRESSQPVETGFKWPVIAFVGLALIFGAERYSSNRAQESENQLASDLMLPFVEPYTSEVPVELLAGDLKQLKEIAAVAEASIPPPETTTTVPLPPKPTPTTLPPPPPPPKPTPTTLPPPPPPEIPANCPEGWKGLHWSVCYTRQDDFHIMRIDLNDPNVSVRPAFVEGPGSLGKLSEATKRLGALVAVNLSFFLPDGQALGPIASEGQWINQDPTPQQVLVLHTDNTVHMRHSEEALGEDVSTVKFALPGSHCLVRDGQIIEDFGVDNEKSILYGHHRRTSVALDRENRLYLVATNHGKTMPELARFMGGLGISYAINVDGGGSRQMNKHGEIVTAMSDEEREISTGLFVFTSS